MSMKDDTFVGLLIGKNCTKSLEFVDIIPSKRSGPYSFKAKLI